MQQISPEILSRVAPAVGFAADLALELAEIANINREFLRLIADSDGTETAALLGLDPATVASLRSLSPAELDRIAAAPQLLAEFSPLPGGSDPVAVADAERYPRADGQWTRKLQDFAQRLLVCLWQAARYNSRLVALNAGLEASSLRRLASQSFSALGRHSANGACYLRARFASHPRFWPDLIRSVRHGNREQQAASRLAVIQLSVSQAGLKKSKRPPATANRYCR